jgi:DNA-binding response OmpR family regulator
MKILIVHHDAGAVVKLVDLLEEGGYSTAWASDAGAALLVLEENNVDAVLLSATLPGASGTQTLDLIRSEPAHAELPVVFLSGLGARQTEVVCERECVRVLTRAHLGLEEIEGALRELGLANKMLGRGE